MNASERMAERKKAVTETVDRIRLLEAEKGVTRESLDLIKAEVMALAAKKELFPVEDFPANDESTRNNVLYRLSEDEDHRFVLYGHVARGKVAAPPHDHTTWAVIAGIEGEELNRLYEHDGDGGVTQVTETVVGPGTAVAFLPDDLHSIHIDGEAPVLNFHMYGLGLEQLHGRRYYRADSHEWKFFPASDSIADLPEAS